MIKYYCDMCKKEKPYNELIQVSFNRATVFATDRSTTIPCVYKYFDVCEDCMNKILKIIEDKNDEC